MSCAAQVPSADLRLGSAGALGARIRADVPRVTKVTAYRSSRRGSPGECIARPLASARSAQFQIRPGRDAINAEGRPEVPPKDLRIGRRRMALHDGEVRFGLRKISVRDQSSRQRPELAQAHGLERRARAEVVVAPAGERTSPKCASRHTPPKVLGLPHANASPLRLPPRPPRLLLLFFSFARAGSWDRHRRWFGFRRVVVE